MGKSAKRKQRRSEEPANGKLGCWCDSGQNRVACCEPVLTGVAEAPTAEALMRSRYSAYVTGNVAYLLHSWHPNTRPSTLQLDPDQRWLGLKIKHCEAGGTDDADGTVAFAARFKLGSRGYSLRETSLFQRHQGRWVYVSGVVQQ